ncbi:hypothetical protein ILUMI_02741 [Ignelater luminosus]|uniref:Uncharacterized protein n=1 Tax=Ignelater luminosus TaxID=2038154 RepID=A0A8K0GG64_IGNLU|nr:hypothetical protein ILUMI_02741 [Ignelater luminosus]
MFSIEGKVALITGGASGIGLCYAKELLKNGLKGVTLADINEKFGKSAVQELEKEFEETRILYIKTDVLNKQQFEDAFKLTVEYFSNLDILINNAGILNDSIWEKQILINVNATIQGTLLGMENYLQKHRSGPEAVIVNIAAIAGLDKFGFIPVYTATKHAVVGLSRSFGADLNYNRTKVKVLTMCPGVTDTPLVDFSGDQEKTLGPQYTKLIPAAIGHLVPQPAEYVAKAMVQIIKEGKSGSVWVAEDKQPPYEVDYPERQNPHKQ